MATAVEHGLGLLALGKRGNRFAPCRTADFANTGSLQLPIERQAARSRPRLHPFVGPLELSDRSAALLDGCPGRIRERVRVDDDRSRQFATGQDLDREFETSA